MGLEEDLLADLEGDDAYDEQEQGDDVVAGDEANPAEQADDIFSTRAPTLKRKASHADNDNGMDEDTDEDEDGVQVKEEEMDMVIPEGGVRPADELDEDDVAKMQLKNVRDVSSVAKLAGSKVFKEVLQVSLR
jgi:U4/U6 small nuclear ribonucleoprotein PRP31